MVQFSFSVAFFILSKDPLSRFEGVLDQLPEDSQGVRFYLPFSLPPLCGLHFFRLRREILILPSETPKPYADPTGCCAIFPLPPLSAAVPTEALLPFWTFRPFRDPPFFLVERTSLISDSF